MGSYKVELPDCDITALAPESALASLPQMDKRSELAIVHDTLEQLPKTEGMQLIARLRDLNAAQLLISIDLNTETPDLERWQAADLYALGLKLRDRKCEKDADLALFEFNLRSYKSTPDWLNARFWANPELWGKHRW